MITLFIFFIFTLLIPILIVIRWRKRPVAAFIIASIILYLSLILPGLIKTFQAMMIYGVGDPELMAGGISQALMTSFLGLPILLPVLAIVQWISRRAHKRALLKSKALSSFE